MSQIEWIYTISWIAFSVVVLAYALCRQPEPAALGGPASESGTLCRGDGGREGATAAEGRSCCLFSRRCPQLFLLERSRAELSRCAESRASATAGARILIVTLNQLTKAIRVCSLLAPPALASTACPSRGT